ncbi:hypothetical protein SYNPS1DRAFT_30953 [Syncephalis pseudoplumigaleata]|uniref:Uncharacterized protein n=1 Tax=Syncephalis pseudoplumigaleata TaxID=1712513 RepID=A0A4P9YU45_9FUNG|nr:hypothetical protein SYNPS1DRAFT_30953 [Syncephalis pseudoplumigaleata]|eukprot:RKP23315.1 hypothetical protein SYNPS1DRAFT_30953 [Syncephalis pseudoplumigaleata]
MNARSQTHQGVRAAGGQGAASNPSFSLASAATILPIPLSPAISGKIGGASHGAEAPLHSTKQELRERSTVAFTELSTLFRARGGTGIRPFRGSSAASSVDGECGTGRARHTRGIGTVVDLCQGLPGTQRGYTGSASGVAGWRGAGSTSANRHYCCHRLKRLSWISDELDLDSMTRRPPA